MSDGESAPEPLHGDRVIGLDLRPALLGGCSLSIGE